MLREWRNEVSASLYLWQLHIRKGTEAHLDVCFLVPPVLFAGLIVCLHLFMRICPHVQAMELLMDESCLLCCLFGQCCLCCNRGKVRSRYSIQVWSFDVRNQMVT